MVEVYWHTLSLGALDPVLSLAFWFILLLLSTFKKAWHIPGILTSNKYSLFPILLGTITAFLANHRKALSTLELVENAEISHHGPDGRFCCSVFSQNTWKNVGVDISHMTRQKSNQCVSGPGGKGREPDTQATSNAKVTWSDRSAPLCLSLVLSQSQYVRAFWSCVDEGCGGVLFHDHSFFYGFLLWCV